MKLTLQSLTDVRADGRQLYAFINAIRRSDIICAEQHCRGEQFLCRIRTADAEQLQTLASKYSVSLELRHRPSLQQKLRRFRLRIGLFLGVMLCGIAIFYFSNTISVIELQGVETVSGDLILTILHEEGVTEGTWIAGIDFTHCERRIRAAVPGIAWVGIRHTGSRLVVEIHESTPKPEMIYSNQPSNIVSMYDAQITGVRVYGGHLVRLLGDGVAAGELLVSGVFEDEKGHITYHHAHAEIMGIYTREAELTEYFTTTTVEETGRQQDRRVFRLFSLRIPLSLGKCSFENRRTAESYVPYSFLGHTLPFGIEQQHFYETQTETTVRSEEETLLALHAAIVRYEKNFLSDVTILDREITYSTSETGITCRLSYTVEGEIGTQSELFVK